MAAFGKGLMRKEFMLDSSKTFLNQGSYGNAPRRVVDYRIGLIRRMEEQPDEWFRWKSDDMWLTAVRNVSDFVGSDPANLVFVPNTTTGVNAVIRSLAFEKGDGILLYRWTYGAVKNACTYISDTRHVELFYADIPFPLKSVSQLLESYEEQLSKHPSIKLVILDYISSMPPTLLPVKELIALCRKYKKLVFIDGAHTPGQLRLNLETLGADFYAGNLHKWAFAPRGSAILWVSPKFHHNVSPVVTSRDNRDVLSKNFSYQGTRDESTYYCSTEALGFYQDIGGHEKISDYCKKLATEGAELLVRKWKTSQFPLPESMVAPFLRLVRLPDLKKYPAFVAPKDDFRNMIRDIEELTKDVWDRFQIQSVFVSVNDQPWCRISASVYNVIEDYEKLADAILTLLAEEQKD